MSSVDYLVKLHQEGKISDSALDEALKGLPQRKSELKLIDKPLCNYFKTYVIDAHRYKDPFTLFIDKKPIIVKQINEDIEVYKGIKFSIGLTIKFFHDEANGERRDVVGKNHGEQSAVSDGDNVGKFYDMQTAYLYAWIEKFTNTASGLEISRCLKLYLNIAKYEPLGGSGQNYFTPSIGQQTSVNQSS